MSRRKDRVRKKIVSRHLRRIAKRAIKKMKIKSIVRKGKHVKHLNYAKPRTGSIMLA